jgi:hypothetical protein
LIAQAQKDGKPTEVSRAQLAEALKLDKSTAGRRAQKAIHDGYLRNLETRDKQLARYVLGDPLPADRPVLPPPAALTDAGAAEGGGGCAIPPCTSALVHQCAQPTEEPQNDGLADPQAPVVEQKLSRERLEPWQISLLDEADMRCTDPSY